MRYRRDIGGVLLSYSAISFPEASSGAGGSLPLVNGGPGAFVDARVTGLMFAPLKGESMVARVTQWSSDHVGLLVMNLFNATVTARGLQGRCIFDAEAKSDASALPSVAGAGQSTASSGAGDVEAVAASQGQWKVLA